MDYGPTGTSEPASNKLRPGDVGTNTAADHLIVTQDTLAQSPGRYRSGATTLIRTDSAVPHEFLDWMKHPAWQLAFSMRFAFTLAMSAGMGHQP